MRCLILLMVLIIAGCYDITGSTVIEKPVLKENIPDPKVYFCPNDPCEDILIRHINNSKETIHCALFDIDLKGVLGVFEEKSKTADVKVVIDGDNFNKALMGGKGIIKDTSSQFSHNKFCIFDNRIVWTGSFNPTNNGAYKNNNNIIIIESKYLSNNYELEFNELWNYNFGGGRATSDAIIYLNGKKYANYFCPEDNCKEKILNELNKAEESIYFMTFAFTDFDIADLLISKKKQGLDVRGLVEAKRVNMQYEQYNRMNDTIQIKKDVNPATMHHKVFIIDNQTIITGSFNPTKAADTKNDENILIINDKDIAQKYLDEFDYLTSLE